MMVEDTASNIISTYVTSFPVIGSANQIIGFDSQLLMDLVIQFINTVILIVLVVFIMRLCTLGIKALKIYINKNS